MRKLQLNSLREFAALICLMAASLFFTNDIHAQCASGSLEGMVFLDIDNNGKFDANDSGIANIEVKAYGPTGLLATKRTSSDGTYSFEGVSDGERYRLEFETPDEYAEAWLGKDNGSNVQLVTIPNCNASYGLINPDGLCDDNSNMYLSCFVQGEPGSNENVATLVGLKYGFNQNSPITAYATKNETGSIWGIAWKTSTKEIFSSAFVKQYASLTSHGHDAIFVTDISSETPNTQLFAKLSDLGVNTGTLAVNNANDCDYGDQVGRTGLGSMVLSPDGNDLYVINIYNNSLVKLSSNDPSAETTIEIPIPNPGCTAGAYQAFALKYHEDKLWIGVTCTADGIQDAKYSQAAVFSYDIALNTFNFEFSTDYIKGFWQDNHSSYAVQHWLTDIDFTDDGNMLLGISDRVGHRYCNDVTSRIDQQHPDLLMVWDDNGIWKLENNGRAGLLTGSGVGNGQGPGNGEFFGNEYWVSNPTAHSETALGSMLVIPGTSSVVSAVYDPLTTAYSGGLHKYNTRDGSKMAAIELYNYSYGVLFGKGTGFGDIAAACGSHDIEIGNFVWLDEDGDGIQSESELPIANVNVCLYDVDFNLLACTTTNAEGNYVFNNFTAELVFSGSEAYNGIAANTCYYVGIDPSHLDSETNTYVIDGANYIPTISVTDNDEINSDLVNVEVDGNTLSLVQVKTGYAGHSMHTFDIGLSSTTEFDLALSKEYLGNTTPRIADDVEFKITVKNEGRLAAKNYTVADHIHDGFVFDESKNPGWTLDDKIIKLKDANILYPGEERSYVVTLGLINDRAFDYMNVSEISQAEDQLGNSDSDIDSTPDDDMNNDALNEDDRDEAQVKIFDLALTNDVDDPARKYTGGELVSFQITVFNQGNIIADDIRVIDYPTEYLSFVPEENSGWIYNGSGYIYHSTTSLAPGAKMHISITYRIDESKNDGTLVNHAEIFAASSSACPAAVDFDSYPDSDKLNDAGGEAGSNSDNNVFGDGSDDEDDHDPVMIRLNYVDLALTKTAMHEFVRPGDDVEFEIRIYNQGTSTVNNVKILDYLPDFSTLTDDSWHILDTDPSGRTVYKIVYFENGLKAGQEHAEAITIRLDDDIEPMVLINYAEIGNMEDMDGLAISDKDIDSKPDSDKGNDAGGEAGTETDGMINNDGSMDEDDHDPAMLVISEVTGQGCECRQNATDEDPGQFYQILLFEAPSLQEWRFEEAVGYYDTASDPVNRVPFETGPMGHIVYELGSVGSGMSLYGVEGEHYDGEAFFVRFVNNNFDVLEFNGLPCYYEHPLIDGPRAVCAETSASYSVPDEAGCTFEWYLEDDGTGFDRNYNGAEITVNWGFAPGTYNLSLVKFCPGGSCIAPVSIDVQLGDTGGQISCVHELNLSLGANCELEVTGGMLLAGNPTPGASYEVMLMLPNGDIIPNATVNETHIGVAITAKLIDGCSGNSCWATIWVEDKMDPVIDCSDAEVYCYKMFDYLPLVSDNCTNNADIEIELINETSNFLDCDDLYIKEVYRTYKATDKYGNESEPCTQKINVLRIPLDSIVFPPDFEISEGTALQCNNLTLNEYGNPDISQTEVPTLEHIPLYPDNSNIYCKMGITYSDYEVETFGCSRKIMRTWTIYEDYCSLGGEDTVHVQTIEIEDKIDPSIVCPDDFHVYTNLPTCEAVVTLPPALVGDECSEPVEVDIEWGFGDFLDNQNGGEVTLPLGIHTITYTVYDGCHNSASCTMEVEVRDGQAPVARCDDDMIVALRSDGTAEMYAWMFDEGSYDNCQIDSMAVRRVDLDTACDPDDIVFGDYVSFCCEDVGVPVMIEFAVWDKYGNMNSCDLMATVQDKHGPIITAPADLTIQCQNYTGLNDIYEMGDISVVEACGPVLLDTIPTIEIECNEGIIELIYVASDGTNETRDTQYVTIENNKHFDLDDVVFPEDLELLNNTCSLLDLDPDDLDPPYDMPTFNNTSCDLVGLAPHKDHVFYVEDDDNTCFKIIRTWKVINYCTDDTITKDQTIKILNTEAPEVDCSMNDTVYPSTQDCEGRDIALMAVGVDGCTEGKDLEWMIEIDFGDDGIIDITDKMLGDTIWYTEYFEIGDHSVIFSFTDQCSNTTSCISEFTVTDNVGPVAACLDQVVVALSPWDIDGDLIPDTEYACIGLDSLDASSFHPCGDYIHFSFDSIEIVEEKCFDCSNIGPNLVPFYVIDKDGQWDVCVITVIVQDNNDHNICSSLDLALIKTINEDESTLPATVGEDVSFDIKIFNQGGTTVDSVEIVDYIPEGLVFNEADNTEWDLSMDGTMATISLGAGDLFNGQEAIPVGGLEPDSCFTISIQLEVDTDASPDNLTNIAEIKSMSDLSDSTEDADSTPDMVNDDVIGGDDEIDNTNGDEDDHDPATVPVFDLALIKTVESGPYTLGQDILFDITVFNQGNRSVDNIEITEYIPCGFDYSVASNALDPAWTFDGLDEATATIVGELAPGDNVTITLLLTLKASNDDCGVGEAWLNYAEISDFEDSNGDFVDPNDIDSNDDGVNDDPFGGDDFIDNTNGDEDDHDLTEVGIFDLALTKVADMSGPFSVGQTVSFTIQVYNQGNLPADEVQIVDYIQCGMTYSASNDDNGWTLNGDMATYDLPGLLFEGGYTTVQIEFVLESLDPCMTDEYVNYAEIKAGKPFDSDWPDIDSTPDMINGNDAGGEPEGDTDDEIDGDGSGPIGGGSAEGDEDDHDPAVLLPCPEITIDPAGPLCADDDVIILVADPSGGFWTGPGIADGITGAFDPTEANIGINSITYTFEEVCVAMIDITIVEPLEDPLLVDEADVCNSEITMELTTLDFTSFTSDDSGDWADTDGTGVSLADLTSVDFDGIAPGNYTFTYTLTADVPCDDFVGSIVVNVLDCACPDISVTITGDAEVCAGESSELTADVTGPTVTYEWSTGEITETIEVDVAGTYSVTVTDEANSNCTASDDFEFTVNALPMCEAGNNSELCEGETLMLTESGGDATSWSWSGPDGFASNDQNPTINNVTPDADGVYTVTITDDNGCVSSCQTTVTIVEEILECPVLDVQTVYLDSCGYADLTQLFDDLFGDLETNCNEIEYEFDDDTLDTLLCNSALLESMTIGYTLSTSLNSVMCELEVEVLDTIFPEVACLPDFLEADCEDLDDLEGNFGDITVDDATLFAVCGTMGDAAILDNCPGNITVDYDFEIFGEECDADSVKRTWTITDIGGNVVVCEQLIVVTGGSCTDDPATLECPEFAQVVEDLECDGEEVNLLDFVEFTESTCCQIDSSTLVFFDGQTEVDSVSFFDVGIHEITINVSDNCDNDFTCSFEIVVVDSVTVRCNKIITNVGDDGTVTFGPEAFSTMATGCGGAVSFELLNLSFDPNMIDDEMTWGCNDPFNDPIEENIFFYIYFETIFGPDSCEAILFLNDPNGVCGNNSNGFTVDGSIQSEDFVDIAGVNVSLYGSELAPYVTEEDGSYAFPNMPGGGEYTVRPLKDDDYMNGVSTLDLVKIQRHVLGIEALDSPYKIIAADANGSDDVTVIDIVEIRKLILGIYDNLPQNTSWRMIDADYNFVDPLDPFVYGLDETYEINSLDQSMTIDFVGVKVGDVNGSAIMNLNNSIITENRSSDDYELLTVVKSADKNFSMSFKPATDDQLFGLQMTLEYDQGSTDIISVIPNKAIAHNFGAHITDNFITISLSSAQAIALDEMSDLFTIEYSSLSEEVFEISSDVIQTEAYVGNDIMPIVLRSEIIDVNEFSVGQNFPNPWSEDTEINVNLAESSMLTLEIYSSDGKLVLTRSVYKDKGAHTLNISASELTSSGVYHYKLSAGKHSVMKRFLLMK